MFTEAREMKGASLEGGWRGNGYRGLGEYRFRRWKRSGSRVGIMPSCGPRSYSELVLYGGLPGIGQGPCARGESPND
jgi:hypothetical protein